MLGEREHLREKASSESPPPLRQELELDLELEVMQIKMAQKSMLREKSERVCVGASKNLKRAK
jgi:hypothetical protein